MYLQNFYKDRQNAAALEKKRLKQNQLNSVYAVSVFSILSYINEFASQPPSYEDDESMFYHWVYGSYELSTPLPTIRLCLYFLTAVSFMTLCRQTYYVCQSDQELKNIKYDKHRHEVLSNELKKIIDERLAASTCPEVQRKILIEMRDKFENVFGKHPDDKQCPIDGMSIPKLAAQIFTEKSNPQFKGFKIRKLLDEFLDQAIKVITENEERVYAIEYSL